MQTRAHRLVNRYGRLQCCARGCYPCPASLDVEVVARYGKRDFLQLSVKREVGLEKILSTALNIGAPAAEIEQDPVELQLWSYARPLRRECAHGRCSLVNLA